MCWLCRWQQQLKEEWHKHDCEAVVNVAEAHAAHNLHSTSGYNEQNILKVELVLFCLKHNSGQYKFLSKKVYMHTE
jgi:hypothetical protein